MFEQAHVLQNSGMAGGDVQGAKQKIPRTRQITGMEIGHSSQIQAINVIRRQFKCALKKGQRIGCAVSFQSMLPKKD